MPKSMLLLSMVIVFVVVLQGYLLPLTHQIIYHCAVTSVSPLKVES